MFRLRWLILGLALCPVCVVQAQLNREGAQFYFNEQFRLAGPPGYFGPNRIESLASGDFDGDGVEDLALGFPFMSFSLNDSTTPAVGGVVLAYGSSDGLSNDLLSYGFLGQTGPIDEDEFFGYSLAVGNVNGLGPTIAVGAYNDRIGFGVRGGTVRVFYSDATGGVDPGTAQIWSQDTTDIAGSAEEGDEFGRVVAFGDFNGNGDDDLLGGMPREDLGGSSDTGGFLVINGSAGELTSTGNLFLDQSSEDVPGNNETGDLFGDQAVTGNFNCDLWDDAAISAPGEDIGELVDAGAVTVFYGSAIGFASVPLQERRVEAWNQDTSGVTGSAEAGDRFGSRLAAGDFDGDGCDDLVIGVDGEDVVGNTVSDGGALAVLYGSSSGLTADNDEFLTESSLNSPLSAQGDAKFPTDMTVADFNNDGFDDLAASSAAALVAPSDSGRVLILLGGPTGLDGNRVAVWTQDFIGTDCGDTVAVGPQFGYRLAAGDWNDDGFPDLAASSQEGVHIIYSADGAFADRFESRPPRNPCET